ncbi:hypothetical protein EDC22_101256 [Tepidamorphus gemmatus]|uniref:YHS domain-containing protein n=2 Tax=Tepidamorphus gemmatus TaxID=747076 RepID=A0A4R3MHS3_9HYPH|nr:hypothetical protein EDC22_101256 [Tepidamorphus gemmatus]
MVKIVSSWGRRSLGAILLTLAMAFAPATAQPVVTDAVTGFAIFGYDPVAYFADGQPREGRDYEADWAGVTWRFANDGNRQAFLEAPTVYAPLFGGYCAVALARGYAAEGDPNFWIIYRNRLVLFHTEANRQLFTTDPDTFLAQAAQTSASIFRH